ncbi:L,D-transpeptidase [Iamia sp. SCSIO 61187]|uniref:L,D-transpeptidase n=1 Tax=Iamia sp. SCSIO 61187 TaxID=2722752 RepID=UPI001C6372E7|nr:L,D-transpeptidase [Iamia sp. SCSIO 61187]QYG95267.1 L,D-transpeptidase [Iamia sp. SCSIO 61187]
MGAPDPDAVAATEPPDPGAAPTTGPPRPHRRRRARRAALAIGVLAVLVVGVALVVVDRSAPEIAATVADGEPAVAEPEVDGRWATTSTTTTAPPTIPATPAEDGLAIAPPLERPWAERFTVADAVGPSVPLFSAPDVPVPSGRALDNPTWEGLPLTFLVRERRGGWLRAQIMSRPNSALAWIRAGDVTLRTVEHHIVIERGARRLTVYRGEEVVLQTSVATGKASSPTPLGTFFVDGVVRLSPPHRAYGTGQLSFTGFSEVHTSFGGGVGQVAMHGTQNPALIGTPASAGCVRMRNEDIDAVTALSPTGTPVEVVA